MKKIFLSIIFFFFTNSLNSQQLYPDSAVVIGYSHFVYATGEVSGSRVSVRDSSGNIHVVYGYRLGDPPFVDTSAIFYVFSTDNGITWSVPFNISQSDSQSAIEPDITIDSRNRLHCVWKQRFSDTSTIYNDYDLYYSRKDSAGWTRSINISNQSLGANACYSSMAVDSRDYVHVVWDMSMGPGNWDIFYSFYNDTTWSEPIPLSTSPYDDAFPALAIDRNDELHVVWRQRTNTAPIYYTKRQNQSWSTPEIIASFPGGQSAYPCIVVDSLNHPNVIFQYGHPLTDSGNIFFQYLNDSVWSPPENISNSIRPSFEPSLSIDNQNILYCAWIERVNNPDPDNEVYFSVRRGAYWTTPIDITQDTSTAWCPKLGNPIRNGRMDLIWTSFFSYPPETYEIVYLGLNTVENLNEYAKNNNGKSILLYPNPFRNKVMICGLKDLFSPIYILDITGRIMKTIMPNPRERLFWNGDDDMHQAVPPGVYFLRFKGEKQIITKKVIKMK